MVSEICFDESSSEAPNTVSILQLKNSMTYCWNSVTFPWLSMTAVIFHDFQAWTISFLNFKTFHDFPGCVGTLLLGLTKCKFDVLKLEQPVMLVGRRGSLQCALNTRSTAAEPSCTSAIHHTHYSLNTVLSLRINLTLTQVEAYGKTRNSAIADKPHDAFRGQSRSPNMVPFHMLGMVSYYCPIVTLSIRRHCFEIFNLKNVMTLQIRLTVHQDHWKCHHVIDNRYRAYDFLLMFYSNLALSRVVSEKFNVEKYCDLEILVKGQSRSLKVVPFDRLGLVF